MSLIINECVYHEIIYIFNFTYPLRPQVEYY
jgi:hypothetical protein